MLVTLYDSFITHAKFKKHLEVSKFLSVCSLNTHHHLGKIWTKTTAYTGTFLLVQISCSRPHTDNICQATRLKPVLYTASMYNH